MRAEVLSTRVHLLLARPPTVRAALSLALVRMFAPREEPQTLVCNPADVGPHVGSSAASCLSLIAFAGWTSRRKGREVRKGRFNGGFAECSAQPAVRPKLVLCQILVGGKVMCCRTCCSALPIVLIDSSKSPSISLAASASARACRFLGAKVEKETPNKYAHQQLFTRATIR